jgi:LemA protein
MFSIFLGVLFIVIVIGLIWFVVTFNQFKTLEVKSEEALSAVDTVLVQRYDTLGNLIKSVKGYMAHETETLEKITELRTQVAEKQISRQEMIQKEQELKNMLPNFSVLTENYPDLKASGTVQELMESVNYLEENISASRRAYNAVINQYNQKRAVFPSSIISGFFGFTEKEFFEIEEQKKQNIEVDFR